MPNRTVAEGGDDTGIPRNGDARIGLARAWLPSALAAAMAGLALQALPTSPVTAQNPPNAVARGEQLYHDQGCYGCHTMGKTGTPIAPDLSKIGAKHDRAYLEKWLRNPASQRPSAHMPRIEMTESDASALAAYLSSLR
jgi:mono/diheme cytochrome c family protein